MNFSYGIIGIVGVLAAISIGFIVMDPTDVIEPRVAVDENLVACTMQWDPMCGVDGETYGNMCMLDAADAKLDYQGECVAELAINPIEIAARTPTATITPYAKFISSTC